MSRRRTKPTLARHAAVNTMHLMRGDVLFEDTERSRKLQALLLALATLAILFARRPDQFLYPYLWVEDGTYILKAYAERRFASVIEPVQGYHILTSKIIALTAFKASILWTPEIALWLTVALTAAVVIAIALSPTHLPWRFACAVAVLLVPSNPEVFAVSEMSFWWAGLLLILALLWDPDRGKAWLRWLYIVLGGLSAPIIVPVCGLLGLRAVVERRWSEYAATAWLAIVAAVQLITAYGNVDVRGPKFDLPIGRTRRPAILRLVPDRRHPVPRQVRSRRH